MEINSGNFFVIEGLDGSGKSAQAKKLADNLRSLGYKVNLSSEPTMGPVGALIRLALNKRLNLDQKTIAALFAADRVDHVYNPVNGIKKHLGEGIIEISDRYDLTSYAYQSLFNDKEWVFQLNSQAIRPDITVFLDVNPKECVRRLAASKIEYDLYESESHLQEARQNYINMIDFLRQERKETIVIIDAEIEINLLASKILEIIKDWLLKNNGKTNG